MNKLALLVMLVVVSACTPSAPQSSAPIATKCSGPAPSYRSEVEPLVKRYCVSCHAPGGDAGEDHDFTRFEVLHAQRRRVKAALDGAAMPPRGLPQPTDVERALLSRWACLGAPPN